MAHSNQVLEIRRTAIGDAEVHEESLGELHDGQIRLRIDRFAVTANNVSYAGAGDLLGYWDFFPSSDPSTWGRVPAVGYAEIVESRSDIDDVTNLVTSEAPLLLLCVHKASLRRPPGQSPVRSTSTMSNPPRSRKQARSRRWADCF